MILLTGILNVATSMGHLAVTVGIVECQTKSIEDDSAKLNSSRLY